MTENTKKETCIECGKSVAFGSGKFVNRIPVLDDYDERVESGCANPAGEWLCEECDKKGDE